MRKSIFFLVALGFLAVGTIGTTADAEAQSPDCKFCNSLSGTCSFSYPSSPAYDACYQGDGFCVHWGTFCDITPVLETTVDGMAEFASRSEVGAQGTPLTEEAQATAHVRDCAGVILARGYSDQARREIRASTSVITL